MSRTNELKENYLLAKESNRHLKEKERQYSVLSKRGYESYSSDYDEDSEGSSDFFSDSDCGDFDERDELSQGDDRTLRLNELLDESDREGPSGFDEGWV